MAPQKTLTVQSFTTKIHSVVMTWGWQGLLAYGCQNCVVVIDTKTVQVIQTLDKHKGYVVKVKWSSENYHHDIASPYTLRLASADYNGKIIVWDVGQASIRAEFSDGSKPVADMEWLSFQDTSHDLLAVLHPPYSLILWNAATGTKLWKKSYTETLQSVSFDPFEPCRLAFLGQDCILFVEDFSISKVPSSNGKKYYISSPTNQNSNMSHSTSGEKLGDKKGQRQTLGKRVTNILVGESTTKRPSEGDNASINECLQLCFHRACRHHMILLYPRELLLLDLDINQTVGIIPMERTGSPFAQVIPLQQRDVIMCLHENGTLTVRIRRRQSLATPTPESDSASVSPSVMDVAYDLRCQSDPLRITRHSRVYGVASCPVTENKACLIMSDGRTLLWELKTYDYQGDGGSYVPQSPLFTPGPVISEHTPIMTSADSPSESKLGILNNPSVAVPKTALRDLIGHTQAFVMETQSSLANKHGVLLKFVLTGLLNGVASPPLVIRMCPPLTTKNWAVYQPLLAVGTSSGLIQVYNISNGILAKELSIHTCTIRGIEWVSLHSFMTWAYPSPGPTSTVRNELMLTDIQTGKSVPFRPNREEEACIEMVKVSYLKQYFVVLFKDKPFELWDLRTGTLLRQMPKNFPQVTALEWSPAHLTKSLKKKTSLAGQESGPSTLDMTCSASAVLGDSKPSGQGGSLREHFVFTDTNGLLYHFILEGNMLKDGSKIPPDGSMGSITSIAWKAETLVLADVDGNLNLWDLKARVSRAVPTHRGWIKKIKFAPGRGNMKLLVLYADGADIWDTKEVDRLSSVKSPKDMAKISDMDWAASDRPALTCADGIIRIMDTNFQLGSSPMEEGQLTDPIFSPYLLPPKVALTMKYVLQHQPWNDDYKLHLEETEENADVAKTINEQINLLDSEIKEYLPQTHFGTAQRCLLTARLFGDQSEVTFWTIALHYLRAEKAQPMHKKIPRSASNLSTGDLFIPSTPAKESHDLLGLEEGQGRSSSGVGNSDWSFIRDKPLETCYDLLCDAETFQKYQLDRIGIHDSKRSTYEHTKKCAENLIYLGQTDRAVQLLLETESDNDQYYNDCLRACLVASIRSSGASQSTIKLVATNLIASGKLAEGVQLLCLIDKGLDSCRYLQDYGQWDQAAWLAKATLEYAECADITKRWCEYLCSPHVNLKSRAVLVLLSLGQFTKVLELLYGMRHFDRAALFVEACNEFKLLDSGPETKALTESIYLEYGRYLLHLGNRQACEYFCRLAGEKGAQLQKDINSRVYNN